VVLIGVCRNLLLQDNLKKSRDYSFLNQSKASRTEEEDGDWQDGDGGSHGRGSYSSQEKEAGKE
jgi:hypothetical protein